MVSHAIESTLTAPRSDEAWVDDFFRAADSLDVDASVAWFTDDVELRFGNAPATLGKAPAREALASFWSSIAGMRHTRDTVIQKGDLTVQIGTVTYTRLDGVEVSMPVASHLRRAADGRVDRLWVFIDLTPLFAPRP